MAVAVSVTVATAVAVSTGFSAVAVAAAVVVVVVAVFAVDSAVVAGASVALDVAALAVDVSFLLIMKKAPAAMPASASTPMTTATAEPDFLGVGCVLPKPACVWLGPPGGPTRGSAITVAPERPIGAPGTTAGMTWTSPRWRLASPAARRRPRG